MITLLRKHHRWLMIVIAILAIPFVFYFVQKPDYASMHSGNAGTIYGRTLTLVEMQRNARMFRLASELGLFSLLQDLAGRANSQEEMTTEFTFNRLVLRHEADALGIHPTSDEIAKVVKTLRPFRNETGFDMNKYNEFVQTALPSMGFSDAQLADLVSDQLALSRIKDLLATGVHAPDAETKGSFEQSYGKLSVGVVRLRTAEIASGVKIGEDEIAKYYEAHKAQLMSEEKRKVSFVAFSLTEEQKKLASGERVDALQKLADRSNDFEQALSVKGADFAQVAAKFQLPVRTTGDFAQATPDSQLNADPQLAQSAFSLTQEDPNGEPVQVSDGFYVLHLNGVEPARPLDLNAAKPKIADALKTQRTQELLMNRGAEIARKLRESLKTGATLEAAAGPLGLKPETIPPFTLAENPLDKVDPKDPKKETPGLPAIKSAVGELDPGGVSEFTPDEGGGFVAVLQQRDPVDPAQYAQGKALFEGRYLQGKRAVVFLEWLAERRRISGASLTAAAQRG